MSSFDRALYEGMEYSVSKDVDWDVTEIDDENQALEIAPPDFEPMEITPTNSKVFDTAQSSSLELTLPSEMFSSSSSSSSHHASSHDGNPDGAITAKKYGSLGRIISKIISNTNSNAGSLKSPGKPLLAQNGTPIRLSNDERKNICRKFIKYMNVGDMNGLGKYISERVAETCTLSSSDLQNAEIHGKMDIMMLFSLLFESYPDGVWGIQSLVADGEQHQQQQQQQQRHQGGGRRGTSITCFYRFTGTGVIDYPLHQVFDVIRKHNEQYYSSDLDCTAAAAPSTGAALGGFNNSSSSSSSNSSYSNRGDLRQQADLINTIADYCHAPRTHPPNSDSPTWGVSHNNAVGVGGMAVTGGMVGGDRDTSNGSAAPVSLLTAAANGGLTVQPQMHYQHQDTYHQQLLAAANLGTASQANGVPYMEANHSPSLGGYPLKIAGIASAGTLGDFCLEGMEDDKSPSMMSYSTNTTTTTFSLSPSMNFPPSVASGAMGADAIGATATAQQVDDIIQIPRRSGNLREMGIIEKNVLKNGPITQRRKIVFIFDYKDLINRIEMATL